MGLVPFNSNTRENLDSITEELRKQDQWIKHLHNYSQELHKYSGYLKDSNTKHKKEMYDQISNISKWIDYLHNSHNGLKKEINALKHDLKRSLKKDFEAYHLLFEEYFNLKLNEESKKKDKIKEEILSELKELLVERKKQPIINADNDKGIKNIMHYNAKNDISNPEKEILDLLFNENKPMTYENISKKLNKSVNTIRVYMNSLKSKKGIIDEFATPKGIKIFSIKSSELVKTLFNVK